MKVLCVDNEPVELRKMERRFRSWISSDDVQWRRALAVIPPRPRIRCAVVDQNLESDITGEQVGSALRALNPRIYLIMLTAYSSVERAMEAVRNAGFDDYIAKNSPGETALLRKELVTAEKESGYRRTNETVLKLLINKSQAARVNLVGEHALFLEAVRLAIAAAENEITVLLLGESGTGKEEFVTLIHNFSSRSEKTILRVNCAGFPETLLESELFGHERGSFTGATGQRIGKFEQCDLGTIFLDEIGSMSMSAQQRLLRVVQLKTIERVGGNKPIQIDVRIIAAQKKTKTASPKRLSVKIYFTG